MQQPPNLMRPGSRTHGPRPAAGMWALLLLSAFTLLLVLYYLPGWLASLEHQHASSQQADPTSVSQTTGSHQGVVEQGTYDRVVHLPDLHGDLVQTLSVLRMMGLIDQQGRWVGGRSLLVQSGDIVDRGPSSLPLLQLFANLTAPAAAAGGRVVTLLGNHELMLLQGDVRYFSIEEMLELGNGDMAAGHTALLQLLQPGAWVGQLLRSRRLAHISRGIGARGGPCDILFIHAAALPWMLDEATALLAAHPHSRSQPAGAPNPDGIGHAEQLISALDEVVRPELQQCEHKPCGRVQMLTGRLEDRLLGPDGAVWSRHYMRPDKRICKDVEVVRKALQVSRIIVGHTIQMTRQVTPRCGGKLLMADVGMSQAYGGVAGHGVALQCGPYRAEASHTGDAGSEATSSRYRVSIHYGGRQVQWLDPV